MNEMAEAARRRVAADRAEDERIAQAGEPQWQAVLDQWSENVTACARDFREAALDLGIPPTHKVFVPGTGWRYDMGWLVARIPVCASGNGVTHIAAPPSSETFRLTMRVRQNQAWDLWQPGRVGERWQSFDVNVAVIETGGWMYCSDPGTWDAQLSKRGPTDRLTGVSAMRQDSPPFGRTTFLGHGDGEYHYSGPTLSRVELAEHFQAALTDLHRKATQ